MDHLSEFIIEYAKCSEQKREAWLDDMCASPHHRLCLEFTAGRLEGTPVGDNMLKAIAGNRKQFEGA